jgi:imidazolonepropionase-like amidohydrolase
MVLFDQGKIVAVGRDVAVPQSAERIDASGKHVYPGLFDAYTQLGLIEIDQVRATLDLSETGRLNPNVKAVVAVNPDSELIPVARASGVLTALTAPTGGLLSGISGVIVLDGWTWEEMALKPAAGMHLAWPNLPPPYAANLPGGASPPVANDALAELRNLFADARAYLEARRAAAQGGPAIGLDARYESLVDVLEGRLPLVVRADSAAQIRSAVAFSRSEGVSMMLLGGYEAPQCAELLLRHSIPVIVAGVHRLPQAADDAYDAPYTIPARLHELGVSFCIASAGDASNVRNLGHHAGTAAAYGLPPDEAIKAVTLYPARILGVGDRVGSLEAGKDATLIVTTGDPLEVTCEVTQAFIQGRQVDLSDRHKRLYHKYQEKYRRLEAAAAPSGS